MSRFDSIDEDAIQLRLLHVTRTRLQDALRDVEAMIGDMNARQEKAQRKRERPR